MLFILLIQLPALGRLESADMRPSLQVSYRNHSLLLMAAAPISVKTTKPHKVKYHIKIK